MGTHRRNGFRKESFILSVDVGTTSLRCHVYDQEAKVRGSCTTKVVLLYPEEGHVEIEPEALWKGFIAVVIGAVQDAGIQMCQIEALGISTQRATFTTWDRKTGVPFHNFITWQDRRAAELVKSWNRSCTMKSSLLSKYTPKYLYSSTMSTLAPWIEMGVASAFPSAVPGQAIHGVMKVLYFLSRQKRCLAASLIVFSTQHVTMRLVWVLNHYKQIRQAASEGNCCFGTIDTWLLFKLTKGRVHATDFSNASSTGIFDSYQMCWSEFLCSMLSLPLSILPTVKNTNHDFGSTHMSIFGESIPIRSMVADQQAAMFGECCFDVGDVKITMGTGTFMDINTGCKPHTSVAGLYPLVGWKIGAEVVYLAEGNAADTGTAIKWAQELDLFDDVKETSALAYSVANSDGVCFVPSFSGLQAPLNDPKACASFMGLKPSTTKCHLVRAILESIVFRNKQLHETMLRETQIPITKIRVDGGVSSNDFVMQLTADLLGRKMARPDHCEMSCLGAAFVAGLAVGFWKSKEELKKLQSTDKVFLPQGPLKEQDYCSLLHSWDKALKRSMNWYKP